MILTNVIFYFIERHFKQLFTVIITGGLTNSSWHLYQKYTTLHVNDFTFIAYAQKSQERQERNFQTH